MDKALSIIDPSPPHWEKIVTGSQKGPAVTLCQPGEDRNTGGRKFNLKDNVKDLNMFMFLGIEPRDHPS